MHLGGIFWQVFILVICGKSSNGFEWVTKPGTLNACVNDDVSFKWQYDPSFDVSMVYWLYDGKSVLGHHRRPIEEVVEYGTYRGRAYIMEDFNAGLILKNVQKQDSGRYKVQPSGYPEADDFAMLQVHTDGDLAAAMRVDNIPITPGETHERTVGSVVTASISTALDLAAHLIIDIAGDETHCRNETLCSTTITIDESKSGKLLELRFLVNYGFCNPQDETVFIQVPQVETTTEGGGIIEPQTGNNATVIIIVIVVVVVLIVFIFVGAFFYIKRKKNTNKQLSAIEEQYINCCIQQEPPVFHAAMTKSKTSLLDLDERETPREADTPSAEKREEKKLLLVEDPIRRLLLKVHTNKVADIINKFPNGNITVTPDTQHGEDVLVVTSVSHDDLIKAVDELNDILGVVKERKHTTSSSKLLTDSGKSLLQKLELERKVTHTIKTERARSDVYEQNISPKQDDGNDGVFRLGKVTFSILQGDLTQQRVDGIVNSTVETLEFQGAVANNILNIGGVTIKEECEKLVARNGPIDCVAITGAGNLPCNNILHLDTNSKGSWGERILTVLEYARDNKLTSIAFPAYGTGKALQIPTADIAPLVYKAIKEFAEGDPGCVSNVSVVAYKQQDMDDFLFHISKAHRGDKSAVLPGQYPLNNVILSLVEGDLTKCSTNAIVNGTNSKFSTAGAVSKAIIRNGGQAIVDECSRIGHMDKVAVTTSGSLSCDAVIHVDTQDENRRNWEDRIFDVLKEAENKKFKSIAFPAFGTGDLKSIGGITVSMYMGVRNFANRFPYSVVQDVQIVAFKSSIKNQFDQDISKTHNSSRPMLGSTTSEPTAARDVDNTTQSTITLYALSDDAIDEAIKDIDQLSKDSDGDKQANPEDDPKETDQLLDKDSKSPSASKEHHSTRRGNWFYRTVSSFQPYSRYINKTIEDAYQREDPSASWDSDQGTCTIHFQDMEEVMENNPGLKVKVKRKDITSC